MSAHPESLLFPSERVETRPLGHVPQSNTLVLCIGHYHLQLRMEQDAGHIVVMAAENVHLPGLRVVHAPQLDLPIVGACTRESEIRLGPDSMQMREAGGLSDV